MNKKILSGLAAGLLFSMIGVANATIPPTSPPTSVPEPTTMILLGTGIVGLVGLSRRKKK